MENKIKTCCGNLFNYICEEADRQVEVVKMLELVERLSTDNRLTKEERESLKKIPDVCAACISKLISNTADIVAGVAVKVIGIHESFIKN